MKNINYLQISKYLIKLLEKAYKQTKKTNFNVKDKGLHDLVTSIDTSLEKYVLKNLNKKFPDIKVVSEEFNETVKAEGSYFVLDPIDGTNHLANGLFNLWGSQIAYVENDIIVASAIYLPDSKTSYNSAKGFGSFKNGKRFFSKQQDPLHSIICFDVKDLDLEYSVSKIIMPKVLKLRKIAVACVYASIMAEGQVGGTVISDGKPWDLVPGILLMEEAGCLHKFVDGQHVFANHEKTMQLLVNAIKKSSKGESKKQKVLTKATKPSKTTKK